MPEPTKRALLIGIDKYEVEAWRLYGCEHDSKAMRIVLEEKFGFPPGNIAQVLSKDATKKRILHEFEKLIDETEAGDIVVTHYAGHGSQMKDLEHDEPDGKDETIVTHDSHHGKGKQNRDITDDEIHDFLVRLSEKTDFITMIFDCCHSGTMSRDISGDDAKPRAVEADVRTGPEMGREPFKPSATRSVDSADRGPSGWLPLSERYVLIAGCRDAEKSYEKKVKVGDEVIKHGALTFHLCEELKEADSGTTYRDVFEAAAAKVTAHKARQHPQMEGAVDREIFGIKTITPMRSIRVTAREKDVVTLAGGAVHGLRPGSVWAVFEAGVKSGDEAADKLGTVTVESVGPASSKARVNDEIESGAIIKDSGAVLEKASPDEFTLTYAMVVNPSLADESATQVEGLKKALGSESCVREVEPSQDRDATIYLLAKRGKPKLDKPYEHVPQLGALDDPTWVVVTDDGQLMMPAKALDAWAGDPLNSGEGGIPHNLKLLANYREVMERENPTSALHGKVNLELLRQDSAGKWVEAKPERAGGQAVFEAATVNASGNADGGDLIAWRITREPEAEGSPNDRPLFVTLLDLDPAGAIGVVYPPEGAHEEELLPGGMFEVGTRDDEWVLSLPDSYPFHRDPIDPDPVEGTETFKLFVSTEPADFRFLEQKSVRGAVKRAPKKLEAQADWTTVTRAVALREPAPGSAELVSDGLEIGGMVLTTPDISGSAQVRPDTGGGSGAPAAAKRATVAGALFASDMSSRSSVEVTGTPRAETRGVDTGRSTVDVPVPGPDTGQVILTTDAAGRMRWRYGKPVKAEETTRGLGDSGSPMLRYELGDYTFEGEEPTRGIAGAVAKKLFDVVVFPLIEPAIGEVGDYFARKWEEKKRPYRIRSFTPDDYSGEVAAEVYASDKQAGPAGESLQAFTEGPALLMVHGTFSRAHTAFGSMPQEYVERLHEKYGGRVLAFDHFTVSDDPNQNIEWLLKQIRARTDASLDLDIICHSRGGLVSRVLAEKQGESGMNVRRIVFAGSPNGGTALASDKHMGEFIDRYTNLLGVLGHVDQSGTIETLEAVFTVVKQLAVGAFGGLEGIQSMAPDKDWLPKLNESGSTEARYFALASDFTADQSGVAKFFMDQLADRIFGKDQNDLVVPTQSVFDRRIGAAKDYSGEERRSKNGEAGTTGSPFPISEEDRKVFEDTDAIAHSGYFGEPGCEKILEWLSD